MRRIEIKKWNGSFDSPKVITKIRQKIEGVLHLKQTVLLDFEDVRGISPRAFREIVQGWDEEFVKIIACRKEKK